MGEPLRVNRRELSSREIVEAVEDGRHVVIEVGLLGKQMDVAIRQSDGTYYCDTPLKLLTFEDEAGLRNCLEQFRLAEPETDDERRSAPDEGTEADSADGRVAPDDS